MAEDPENKHQPNDGIEGGTGPKAKEISSVPSNQNLESDTNSQLHKQRNLPGFDIMQKSLKKFKLQQEKAQFKKIKRSHAGTAHASSKKLKNSSSIKALVVSAKKSSQKDSKTQPANSSKK